MGAYRKNERVIDSAECNTKVSHIEHAENEMKLPCFSGIENEFAMNVLTTFSAGDARKLMAQVNGFIDRCIYHYGGYFFLGFSSTV